VVCIFAQSTTSHCVFTFPALIVACTFACKTQSLALREPRHACLLDHVVEMLLFVEGIQFASHNTSLTSCAVVPACLVELSHRNCASLSLAVRLADIPRLQEALQVVSSWAEQPTSFRPSKPRRSPFIYTASEQPGPETPKNSQGSLSQHMARQLESVQRPGTRCLAQPLHVLKHPHRSTGFTRAATSLHLPSSS